VADRGAVTQEERERREVIGYFLRESPAGTTVERAEKVTSERIYGRKHDVWDVQATDGRWWVITEPMNLFSQEDFPSMHAAFALHIGVAARLMARQALKAPVDDEERDKLASTWRRYEQAAEAQDQADEAEDFQAVGMRCRECLLTLIAEVATDDMVPAGKAAPKKADFVHWSEHIINTWASDRSPRLRSYLKTVAKATWELVNWLTHARNARPSDGLAAVDATSYLVSEFSMAELWHRKKDENESCPTCGSYLLSKDYDDEKELTFRVCTRCDWRGPGVPW